MADTIARLAALRARQNVQVPGIGGVDPLSNLGGFGSNPGALEAKFYLPDNLADGAPLVVVLHGCTQTAAAYDHGSGWSQLADEGGFALLFPEQQRANNPNLCFNWFLPSDTRRGTGEALSIRQMIEKMITLHGIDRKRIFVTGLSAGGAMASVMLATYPEVFAGGAIIAGLPYGCANTVPEAFDRMRGHGGPSEQDLQRLLRDASPHRGPWPKISIWQGSADHTVVPFNAQAIAGQWRAVHKTSREPDGAENVDGHLRQVWCDLSGSEQVELHVIAGMGHGTPLMTNGADALGAPGPFMLDVGISSTRHIANFWGIAESRRNMAATSLQQPLHRDPRRRPSVAADTSIAETRRNFADKNAAVPATGPNTIKKVIEDALRNAGLMR